MASKPSKNSVSLPRTRHKRSHLVPIKNGENRDRDTNVYIPTDVEVVDLKAWSEFCKL